VQKESVSITKFRSSLTKLCRKVAQGKTELLVTHYYEVMFEVTKLEGQDGIEVGLTSLRDNAGEFLDLLEIHGEVILTRNGKRIVRCVKR
jgi:antitoxin (DNA-binding transcriptional repressor) of toxin-antitoxin stability system